MIYWASSPGKATTPRKIAGRGARRSLVGGRSLALLMLSAAAIAVGGCGSGKPATAQELQLERSDLIAVTKTLTAQEPSTRSEVATTKTAWPYIANGLPANIDALPRSIIKLAVERAGALKLPALFTERTAASLTGPSSSLVGTFRTFSILAARGWQLIGAAIEQIEHGPDVAARFARANVGLYIESVYDAHFGLGRLGKQLLAAYKTLGGANAFGAALSQQQVDALTENYSEANYRLYPHTGVKFGS